MSTSPSYEYLCSVSAFLEAFFASCCVVYASGCISTTAELGHEAPSLHLSCHVPSFNFTSGFPATSLGLSPGRRGIHSRATSRITHSSLSARVRSSASYLVDVVHNHRRFPILRCDLGRPLPGSPFSLNAVVSFYCSAASLRGRISSQNRKKVVYFSLDDTIPLTMVFRLRFSSPMIVRSAVLCSLQVGHFCTVCSSEFSLASQW